MSTSSIFSGSLPTVSTPIPEDKNYPKANTEAVEEVMATLRDSVPAEAEYTPFKRITAPSLADIVDIYPIMEAIASRVTYDDLLSLSLVSKDIHQALGQSTTKSYWKHLLSKCMPLLCYASDHGGGPCLDAQRCLGCKKGVCPVSPSSAMG